MFEHGVTPLKTDHFKLRVSLEELFQHRKLLESVVLLDWNISCV